MSTCLHVTTRVNELAVVCVCDSCDNFSKNCLFLVGLRLQRSSVHDMSMGSYHCFGHASGSHIETDFAVGLVPKDTKQLKHYVFNKALSLRFESLLQTLDSQPSMLSVFCYFAKHLELLLSYYFLVFLFGTGFVASICFLTVAIAKTT